MLHVYIFIPNGLLVFPSPLYVLILTTDPKQAVQYKLRGRWDHGGGGGVKKKENNNKKKDGNSEPGTGHWPNPLGKEEKWFVLLIKNLLWAVKGRKMAVYI
jgi:hypothetical protein